MSKFVLTNVRLFAVAVDLTANSNKVEISAEAEAKDATNYASNGWNEVLGGLASTEIGAAGQWEAGDNSKVDDSSWLQLGTTGPWSVGPAGANVGDLAYFTNALRSSYGLGDAVGEVAPWSGEAKGAWPLVRGQFGHPPGTPRTTTGTGTAVQLGAVAAGKRLYAALHVLSVSGTTPSMTARVESDDSVGFASPTTQLTFSAATGRTGLILRTTGTAITDDWFRVAWTISGTTPSFVFVSTLGIR